MYTTFDRDNPGYGQGPQQPDPQHDYRRDPAYQHPPAPPESHDLTLGMPALLGIFLAIVIICGLAFGYGYSVGHRPKLASSSVAPASPPAARVAAPPLEASTQPVGTAPGPSVSSELKPSPGSGLASPAAAPAPVEEAELPAEASAPAASRISPAPAPGTPYMVQIAAVVHAPDAEALAAALRHDGYNAVVRTEPQDHFLHVQIGPYPTREAARAMRARLQAAGYSPILKP